MSNIYIPQKIVVGFQHRTDTFTKKLGYVTYYDEKNVLRKERSWKGWIDSTIETIEIENKPKSGFIFNKGIRRYGEWYGSGRTVFRVYSPDDFEFEINYDNLINLLMHSDVTKREILEECVFAWAGTELILLPTNSEEYKAAQSYTKEQFKSVSAKELVPGHTYRRKKQTDVLMYLGRYEYISYELYSNNVQTPKGKKHMFAKYNSYSKCWEYFPLSSASVLSSVVNDTVDENFSSVLEDFLNSEEHLKIVGVHIEPITEIEEKIVRHGVWEYLDFYPKKLFRYSEDGVVDSIYLARFNRDTSKQPSEYGVILEYSSIQRFYVVSDGIRKMYINAPSQYDRFGRLEYIDTSNYGEYKTTLNGVAPVDPEGYKKFIINNKYGKLYFVLENGKKVEAKVV